MLLALVTRGWRTREGKDSQAFAREQRKWGGTGGWQCPKAEVRGWSCGRGGNVKGRRLGTGSEGNCITHQNSGEQSARVVKGAREGWQPEFKCQSEGDYQLPRVILWPHADTQMWANPLPQQLFAFTQGVHSWRMFQDESNADSDWGRSRQLCFSRWTLEVRGLSHAP